MQKIDQEKIKEFYNNVSNVWAEHDPWHEYSHKTIASYINKKSFLKNSLILNAGSAGNTYDINCQKMYHVDIADEKIKNVENAVVSSIENMPFINDFFDNIICVGSVLNYCDALAAISELSRVLKPNGNLILEYESSYGFEYIGSDCYKKDANIITTEYIEKQHTQWLYSPKYISAILKSCNFSVAEIYPFHILDSLFIKSMNDKLTIAFASLDNILRKCPFIRNHGNNIITHCIKNSI